MKVGKRQPFTIDKFDDFFRLLPKRGKSDQSWTVDFANAGSRPPRKPNRSSEQAQAKQQEANAWKEKLAELKKAKPVPTKKIDEAEEQIAALTREARELAARAQDIEDAVYDLKAVNPNKQADEDTRTPAELLDIIEQKGREVAEAVAALRAM